MTSLRQTLRRAIELVLPARCVGCGRGGTYLCKTCLDSMDLPPAQTITAQAFVFTDATSAFSHDGVARTAVHHLKFSNLRAIAPLMAAPIAALVRRSSVDTVVPLALHPSRMREQGYNQAHLLAKSVAHALQLPLGPGLLQRRRQTATPVGARAAARQANVKDAFAASGAVRGRRIAMIDDVMTTGATLDAATTALMDAGAASVHCYTFAKED